MKILWIVNTIFPYPSLKLGLNINCFGGWLNGLAENLKNDDKVELGIATVYYGKEIKKIDDGKIIYYLIPGAPALKYNKKMENFWKSINEDFKPDLVHIHGTEYTHGLAFMNACPDKKIIVSIQGLVHKIAEVYTSNIQTSKIIKSITIRDIVKQDNIFQQKERYKKRGKKEIEIIERANYVIGRTAWDYSNVKALNSDIKYFLGNETLRKSFYENIWDINNIEKYSIFCSQAGYPIKGFHFLLKTISLLKKHYPQVKLYVGGINIINSEKMKSKIKMTGYGKYINSLIKKYNLENNVNFLGILSENEMLARFLKTHVFVLPSVIENSSNSLGEAMLLGMPCVASNTGGTMDILKHNEEGYLYPYTEPAMCAEYISRFFKNNELAVKLGEQARKTALERHNQQRNLQDIIKIYNEVLGEK